LFQPTVKIFIEKVKLAKELKRVGMARAVGEAP
jgi:hypothetical protein